MLGFQHFKRIGKNIKRKKIKAFSKSQVCWVFYFRWVGEVEKGKGGEKW